MNSVKWSTLFVPGFGVAVSQEESYDCTMKECDNNVDLCEIRYLLKTYFNLLGS